MPHGIQNELDELVTLVKECFGFRRYRFQKA